MDITTGESKCTYKGGLRYTGGMLNGEFHGKGRLVFAKKGGWYEGEYKLGRQASSRSSTCLRFSMSPRALYVSAVWWVVVLVCLLPNLQA